MTDQAAIVDFLAQPATHGGHRVSRIDTHGAFLFMAGKRAYKLKRSVRFAYMDYSSLEKRRLACEAEVRLNRRTAPGLYRGTEAIRLLRDGSLRLGGPQGRVVDWVVVMRRFEESALLSRVAARGGLDAGIMRTLAEAIWRFHDRAEIRKRDGGIKAHRAVAATILAEIDRHAAVFDEKRRTQLRRRTEALLELGADALERRRAAGRVRHGHGDLHLRNICLLDGVPTLFDCLEFDPELAIEDVLYDVAYLLMDLDRLNLRPLANLVLNRYLELGGDYDGLGLMPLFLSQRAAIRAHVLASTADVAEEAARQKQLRREAGEYLDLALAYAKPAAPRFIAIGGLSGTGKSSVARLLAPKLAPAPGAVVLRSDVLRKQLAGVGETERLPASAYTATTAQQVYGELLRRAALVAKAGHSVIVDATFTDPVQRRAVEKAAPRGVPFTGLWLAAARRVLLDRVVARRGDASDADRDTVAAQAQLKLGDIAWHKVPAGGTLTQNVRAALARLRDAKPAAATGRRAKPRGRTPDGA